MAATKSQGKSFSLFMVGVTVTAAGIAASATGAGIAVLVVGLAILAITGFYFFKIKPDEGAPASASESALLKLVGLALAVGGWLVVLAGIRLTDAVTGRLALTLVGLAISLVGVLGVLPAVARKNAIWKA